MRRKLIMLLMAIVAVFGVLGIMSACAPEEQPDPEPTAENGEYYCDIGTQRNTLELIKGYKFTWNVAGEEKSGDYSLDGAAMTFTFDGGTVAATYRNETVQMNYNSVDYKFIRKVEYTVHFDLNGGSGEIPDATVLNGKTVTKPATDPTKTGQTFVDWYTDSTNFSGTYYSFTRPVTGNLTLYARYVDPADPEFDVTYNTLGGDAIASTRTKGGKVFNLPEAQKADATFTGWWVSMFDSADKLSYQYTEDMALAENTTLFAVYNDEAMPVSVSADGVTWASQGLNKSYSVEIKTAAGTVIASESGIGNAQFPFSFAEHDEGEYVVTVSCEGTEESTTAYFNNKALARVSSFKVEENTLIFNGVENATKYYITVNCGLAGHRNVHTKLALDGTSYNFSRCDMGDDGITFTVYAEADGFASSVSRPYNFTRTLAAVSGLSADGNAEKVSWSAVAGAESYEVKVTKDGAAVVEPTNVGAATEFDMKYLNAGTYSIEVTPRARNWKSPAAAALSYTKSRLATPRNLTFTGGTTFGWNEVEGANNTYTLTVDGAAHEVTGTSADLTTYFGATKSHTVSVSAGTGAAASLPSEEVTFSDTISAIVYKDGEVSWTPVFGVTQYQVKVTSDVVPTAEPQTVEGFSAKVALNGKNNTITVTPVGAEASGNSITVTAYKVTFHVEGYNVAEVDPQYLADGDRVEFVSDIVKDSFTFDGWYTAPNGVKGEGHLYDSYYFTDKTDIELYAGFTPDVIHIALHGGSWATEEPGVADVDFESLLELPVPESSDVRYVFEGWYTAPDGGGVKYADYRGKSSEPFTNKAVTDLHAHWAEVFTFDAVSGGYAVSKGTGTNLLKEITVPETYLGQTVVNVSSFADCNNVETINIPSSVRHITIGADALAFSGCSSLRAVNIVPATMAVTDEYYKSVDGVLIALDPESGAQSLAYFPIGKNVGIYQVPDGVQVILARAFYRVSGITEVRIPSTVVTVQTEAFRLCSNIQKITFDNDISASKTRTSALAMQKSAFYSLTSLKEVTLPAKMSSITTYSDDVANLTFRSCSLLGTINVVGDTGAAGEYCSIDGVLCKWLAGSTKELVFYPTAKDGTNVRIPTGVSSIGSHAFRDASQGSAASNKNILKVTIPGYVTNIKSYAFAHASALATLTFEGTAKDVDLTIGEQAFYGTGITALTLPENLIKLDKNAFGSTSKLKEVTVNSGAPKTGSDAARTLNFAADAFATTSKSTYLTTVHFGQYVANIDIAGVFGSKLTSVNIDSQNTNYWSDREGVVYNGEKTSLVYYPAAKQGEYNAVDTLTEVGANVFKDKTNLTGITLPKTLTSIANEAFRGCNELISITFIADASGNPAPLTIGNMAFSGCRKLASIVLPERTTTIGSQAFKDCKLLTSVTIPKSVTSIATTSYDANTKSYPNYSAYTTIEIFDGCSALTTITVTEGNKNYASKDGVLYAKKADSDEIDVLLYCPVGKTGSLEIPKTVSEIKSYAFKDSQIETVTFEDDTADHLTIDMFAFNKSTSTTVYEGCKNLTSVNLPKGLEVIGDMAFARCNGLTEIEIPYTVTSIGLGALMKCAKLQTITFEATPMEIAKVDLLIKPGATYNSNDYGAFTGTPVKTLELPERLKELGHGAFANCTELTSVTLPASLEKIGSEGTYKVSSTSTYNYGGYVFNNDAKLTTVTITDGDGENASKLKYIGDYAFSHTGITTLTLPKGLEKIQGKYSFAYTPLKTITWNNLKVIGDDAFYRCSELEDVTFPDGLTQIGAYAFAYSSIKNLTIPSSVTSMVNTDTSSSSPTRGYAFAYCDQLETVTFQGGCHIDFIENGTFESCHALRSVDFGTGSTVTKLGLYAFENCRSLTTIKIPASVTFIGYNHTTSGLHGSTFNKCSSLASVEFEEGSKLETITNECFAATGLTSFTFPKITQQKGDDGAEEVKSLTLGKNLFMGCTKLTTVTLSASVTDLKGYEKGKVDGYVFTMCPALTNIIVAEDNTAFYSDGTALYTAQAKDTGKEKGTTLMLAYSEAKDAYQVADGTVEIYANAFKGQIGVTSLSLPTSLQVIGENAFLDCINLASVEFRTVLGGQEIQLATIGANAFKNTALTTIDLSKTKVTQIGANMFENTELQTISLPDGLTKIGESAFKNTPLKTIDLSKTKLTEIAKNTFEGTTELQSVTLNETIKNIGENAFKESGLPTLVFPKDGVIETIGNAAFYMSKLQSIDLSKQTKLKNLGTGNTSFPSSSTPTVTTSGITRGVFAGCTELTSVKLPNSIEFIVPAAFFGCTSLTKIDLSNLSMWTTIKAKPGGTATATNKSSYMFMGCTNLEEVDLPEGLTHIDGYMFADCYKLDYVKVGATGVSGAKGHLDLSGLNGLVILGQYAFRNCGFSTITMPAFDKDSKIGTYVFVCKEVEEVYTPKLTKVIFPKNAMASGQNTFRDSTTLQTVEFAPDYNGETLNTNLFYGCTALQSITIPECVTKLGNSLFQGCTSLSSANIPGSISTDSNLGTGLFSGCTNLSKVTFGTGFHVTKFSNNMFLNCSSLQTIDIPDSITSFGSNVFEGTAITEFTAPANLTATGLSNYLFRYCTQLKTVDLSAYTGSIIYMSMFNGCTALDSVTLSDSIKTIQGSAFMGCTALKSIDLTNVQTVQQTAFQDSGLTEVTFGDSTTTIGYNAFAGTQLKQVHLPQYLSSFGYGVFLGCDNITFTFDGGEDSQIILENNAFYTVSDEGVITLGDASAVQSADFTVKEGTQIIGDNAFKGNKHIGKVNLGDAVTTIKQNAFEESSVTEISLDIPALTTVGLYVFRNCTSLATVTLKEGMTISDQMFKGCTALKSIELKEGQTIGSNAFEGSGLQSVTIPENIASIGNNAFLNCMELTSATVNGDLQYVQIATTATPTYLFDGCESLANLTLNNVTVIGKYWFRNAKALTSFDISSNNIVKIDEHAFEASGIAGDFTIPETVETIGNNAFAYTAVTHVTINNECVASVLSNGDKLLATNLFQGCESLNQITLGEDVTIIGNNWFRDCTALTAFTIPGTVEKINDYAFSGTGITSIEIPTDVEILKGAFADTKISEVTIPEGLTYLGDNVFAGESLTKLTIKSRTLGVTYSSSTSSASYIYSTSGVSQFGGCPNLETVIVECDWWFYTKVFGSNPKMSLYMKGTVLPYTATTQVYANAFEGWTEQNNIYFKDSEYTVSSLLGVDWRSSCPATLHFSQNIDELLATD